MVRHLETMSYKEGLKELKMFRVEEKQLRGEASSAFRYLKGFSGEGVPALSSAWGKTRKQWAETTGGMIEEWFPGCQSSLTLGQSTSCSHWRVFKPGCWPPSSGAVVVACTEQALGIGELQGTFQGHSKTHPNLAEMASPLGPVTLKEKHFPVS